MHIVSHRGSSLSSPRHPIHACPFVRCVVVVLFTRLLFLFVPLLFFQTFQMSSSEFHERLKSKDLRDFRLGTVASSDHETPLTQSVQTSRGSAENNTSFSVKLSARVFYQCQVNSRLVTIVTSQVFFKIFFKKNLVDRDLTEHQITQTLTLSRLDAQLEQTRGIRLFTHTQQVDWSRQGESDCLIKQVILRLLSSVQCSSIRANL